MLVVNDKELEERNDSDILTNTVRMRDMEVYTYKLNLYLGNYLNLVMRRVKNKTDWKNKIQFQLRKINFEEISLNTYVTSDT